jgi:DNA adenine methylase
MTPNDRKIPKHLNALRAVILKCREAGFELSAGTTDNAVAITSTRREPVPAWVVELVKKNKADLLEHYVTATEDPQAKVVRAGHRPLPNWLTVSRACRLAKEPPHQAGKRLHCLKYHGGKFHLAKRIVELMPPHKFYVEPFAGGLGVLLAKNPNGVSELVNDLNIRVSNFWKVLRDDETFKRFQRAIEATPPVSRPAFEEALAHVYGNDPIADAVAFFTVHRQSMGGRGKSWSPPEQRIIRGMNGSVSRWLTAIDGLTELHARLRRVVIENTDAIKQIQKWDIPDALLYLDPTYLAETRASPKIYDCEMTAKDHRRLLDVVTGCRHAKVMLSGYDSELYNTALSSWKRYTFNVASHAAKTQTKARRTEALWTNFSFDSRPC